MDHVACATAHRGRRGLGRPGRVDPALAVFSGPSDGTTISPPTAMLAEDRWGDSVTVIRAYGATPLREGDLILAVDGRRPSDAVPASRDPWAAGDVVRYRVRRSAVALDRILELDVTLIALPGPRRAAPAKPSRFWPSPVLGSLVAGAVAFWHRPRRAPHAGLSWSAAALAPGGAHLLAVRPGRRFRPRPARVACGRTWPREVACAVGVGAFLVVALTLAGTPGRLRDGRWRTPLRGRRRSPVRPRGYAGLRRSPSPPAGQHASGPVSRLW